MSFRTPFVKALVRRDLWKYFTNPTGYVFVTLFIFLSAAAAFWRDRFFLDNLANLDQLNEVFPYLLVFFVPALTMGIWAEERKQGTDELLLTLPATSGEVVAGKFFAAMGVYTASLVLSLSHVLVLFWLGSPDLGLMLSNYLGYWLLGGAMIAVGMLASLLTSNATIAFILGALLCGFFVFIDWVSVLGQRLGDWVAGIGVVQHFEDFASGVMSLSGIFYFVALTALMLYFNVLLLERRHWPKQAEGYPMWAHQAVRIVSLVVAVLSLNALLGRSAIRLDTTAEGLHSLSRETRRLLTEIPEDRPVLVEAFVSPEVPEPYVQTRENLLALLREIEAVAAGRVQVLVRETEPFTEEARDARERFGISPREIPNLESARTSLSNVFLGIAFTSGAEEEVIPFLDRGLPAEYELVRSIRVVARTERKKIGVISSKIRLFGGFDFQSMQSTPPWSVVEELKKQYEVVQLSPTAPITEEVDALMVALPSSLTQEEMDNVATLVKSGVPAVLLIDPLPVINVGLAPMEESGADMNPFMRGQAPPPSPKGDIRGFLEDLGIRWDPARIVWDSYNPHPDLAQLPPEVVFVGSGNQNEKAFNTENPISNELQEIVLLYPGTMGPADGEGVTFSPLLETGAASGSLSYFQMVQRNFLGVQLNRNLPHRPEGQTYVLAADVSKAGSSSSSEGGGEVSLPSRVIVIGDLDFISEQFFQIRERGPENLTFDNVSFFLNSIDSAAGDDSFLSLRTKRVRHRTLTRVEDQTRAFVEERLQKEQEAEQLAEQALQDAQQRLDQRVAEVRERTDLDVQTKQIMARNLQEVESRKFEVLKSNVESEKEARIAASRVSMEEQIRNIQNNIKTFAVMIPPIPVFGLGVLIFLRRQRREREAAAASRRLRA